MNNVSNPKDVCFVIVKLINDLHISWLGSSVYCCKSVCCVVTCISVSAVTHRSDEEQLGEDMQVVYQSVGRRSM